MYCRMWCGLGEITDPPEIEVQPERSHEWACLTIRAHDDSRVEVDALKADDLRRLAAACTVAADRIESRSAKRAARYGKESAAFKALQAEAAAAAG